MDVREYMKEYKPMIYNELILSGELHFYLDNLNGEAKECLKIIIDSFSLSYLTLQSPE